MTMATKYIAILFGTVLLLLPLLASAGDDASIKGELRSNIKQSMAGFINNKTVDNHFYLYDAVSGKLLKLQFEKLHKGIVKKGDFYVSCADFVDQDKRKIDVDFLVRPSGDKLITTQGVVHAIDGNKRQYHLEK